MKEINKEKKLNNGIEPVSIEKTEKIINQMKNCVCKIYINGSTATGFFTKIPYKNKMIKVLITNNHVLDENAIKNNNIITYIVNNNEDDQKSIIIDDKRIRFTHKELDVTIIEIDEEKDNIHDYIEIDNNIINNLELNKDKIIQKYKDIYSNESIYLLNYMNGKNVLVSYGLIIEINGDKGIMHKCNTDNGSSGSPILSLKNNKLIGVHYGSLDKFQYNLGTLIIYAIIEFNKIEYKINEITNEKANSKFNETLNTYGNEISIIYKINNNDKKIKLFGKEFIENNRNNCKIIIDNKEQEIIQYIDINEKMEKKDKLEIKLKEIKTITNMSYIFGCDDCHFCFDKLISLPDISEWDTKNVTNMSNMFNGCESLSSLPDISKWDTKNVTDMSGIFGWCESLLSLPDISKWDTKNVTNMCNMFYCCESLLSLPDISKWNTENAINMSYMFYCCESLLSLPDISKWDTKNVTDMCNIFYCCESLLSLPDISKWVTKNVINMSEMFRSCKSLTSLPDISIWDTKKVKNMSSMFYSCSLLSSLPDIFKWNIENVTDMSYMFCSCNKLSQSDIPIKFKVL